MSGPIGSSQWMYSSGAEDLGQSIRLNDDDSQYLSWTPASAGNLKTWTWSGWVKRGNLGVTVSLMDALQTSGTDWTRFHFNNSDQLAFVVEISNSNVFQFVTTQVFRDPSAWYHIVAAYDSTQATSTNRFKLYVNGEQITAFDTETYGAQNTDSHFTSTIEHNIGAVNTGIWFFDGYMSDINFIDGQALDATSFGETVDGYWKAKDYAGTYGTNGFRLEFAGDTTDSSGKGNDFTANNIVTSSYVPDSPNNNFATYNPLVRTGQTTTYQDGNLSVTTSTTWSSNVWRQGSMGIIGGAGGGKYYFEFVTTLQGNGQVTGVGVQNSKATASTLYTEGVVYYNTVINANGSSVITGLTNNPASNVLRFAFDASNGKVWIGNSTGWYNSGDPANGTGEVGTIDNYDGSSLVPITNRTSTAGTHTFNFGQDSTFSGLKTSGSANGADGNGIGKFFYDVPNGFLAMCSANLPTPSIIDGSTAFSTVLYTGDNADRNIDAGFKSDFVWIKQRSSPNSHHRLYDSVRGDGQTLFSSLTSIDADGVDDGVEFAYADGFNIDVGANVAYYNGSASTYVAWNWKAGTAFSNSAGANGATIASSGSANTDAGFSIVSYTGNLSAASVYHGLNKPVEMIIIKDRDFAYNWQVYHKTLPTDYALLLNTTAQEDDYNSWNNAHPTSTTFPLGATLGVNKSGDDHIAYCFHSVDGYCHIGEYLGNGQNDGAYVHTGGRVQWLMIKRVSAVDNWVIDDAVRSPFNEMNNTLRANLPNEEYTGGLYGIDFLSNGFKIRDNDGNYNGNGHTYAYLAIMETPQKFANAR